MKLFEKTLRLLSHKYHIKLCRITPLNLNIKHRMGTYR